MTVALSQPGTSHNPLGVTRAGPLSARLGRCADVLLWATFAFVAGLTWLRLADDPLITLRYAWNVLHGNGPVFNSGQRVEGFTSPLHLVVIVGALAFPLGAAILKAKLVSLFFAVLTLATARRLITLCGLPAWATVLGCGLLGGNWVVAYSAGNALETSLTMWLVTLLLLMLITGEVTRREGRVGLVASLCVLARPEMLLIVCALGAASLVVEHDTQSRPRRLRWLVGPLVVVAAGEIVRLTFYGNLLPNTYFAKHMPLSMALRTGSRYLLSTFVPQAARGGGFVALMSDLVAVLMMVAVVIGAGVAVRAGRLAYLVPVCVANALFILLAGGDWMIGNRFAAPAVPALIILIVMGLARFHMVAHDANGAFGFRVLVGAAIVSAILPVLDMRGAIWSSRGHFSDAALMRAGAYPQTPMWLAAQRLMSCVPEGGSVAATEIGYVGFSREDVRILDMRGLTNATIARHEPRSVKSTSGVDDPNWASPVSVVGREILRWNPDAILSVDGPPLASVYNGRDIQAATRRFGDLALVLYLGRDHVCPTTYRQ
jgi:hypothetical protein